MTNQWWLGYAAGAASILIVWVCSYLKKALDPIGEPKND
jgi:hypothetical protein